jgi:hypothetical protein
VAEKAVGKVRKMVIAGFGITCSVPCFLFPWSGFAILMTRVKNRFFGTIFGELSCVVKGGDEAAEKSLMGET